MTLLANRYELKFVIDAAQHARFVELAGPQLVADAHGTEACYRVSSVYFDAPGLRCWREKVDGVAERRKLRLRWYGEVGEGGAAARTAPPFAERRFFLEIKHRAAETIHKQRLELTAGGALALLEDASELTAIVDHVAPADRGNLVTIGSVERLAAVHGLVAANVITYRREAWQDAVDQRLRITFDTAIRALFPHQYRVVSDHAGASVLPFGHFVLEVKFDGLLPRWVKDLLRLLNLRPARFSKYANGLTALQALVAGTAGLHR